MIKFVPGQSYVHTFANDSEMKVLYLITRRTAKSVWVQRAAGGPVVRRAVKTLYGAEYVLPESRGSFAPQISADKPAEEVPRDAFGEDADLSRATYHAY